MVKLNKVGLVAEVDLHDTDDGSKIGTGFIERTRSGYVIVHVDLSKIPEYANKGFSIDAIRVTEDKDSIA